MTEKQRNIMIPVVFLFVPFIAYIGYRSLESKVLPLPYYGNVESVDGRNEYKPVGKFSFINPDHKVVTEEIMKGRIAVVSFFFSSCPSICPEMLGNELRVAREFGNDPEVVLLSISVDPESDSPEQLKSFSSLYTDGIDNWEFLTGEKASIYRFARNEIKVTATEGDGGPDDFIHSDMLVLIDREGKIRGYYKGTEPRRVDEIINDIHKLKKS